MIHYLFWLTHLEARPKIHKYFCWFSVQMKTSKFAFEINWPLVDCCRPAPTFWRVFDKKTTTSNYRPVICSSRCWADPDTYMYLDKLECPWFFRFWGRSIWASLNTPFFQSDCDSRTEHSAGGVDCYLCQAKASADAAALGCLHSQVTLLPAW